MGHFYVYWEKGENNYRDYYTKHHPPPHYVKMRTIVLKNPPDAKYHSSKGVLVVPRRLKKRATAITVNGKNTTVNGKEKTVIDQRKILLDYLSSL